jgi:hypothetical protein
VYYVNNTGRFASLPHFATEVRFRIRSQLRFEEGQTSKFVSYSEYIKYGVWIILMEDWTSWDKEKFGGKRI